MKKLLLYLMAGALGIAGTTAAYEFLNQEPFPKAKQETKQQEKSLENITFEQAKLNPSLRQVYLDQILANKDKIGDCDKLWDSFGKLVYDLNFEKEKEYSKLLGNIEIDTPEGIWAITPVSKKLKGKNQLSFIGERSFLVANEDDFLSVIDHESCHAYIHKTHTIPDYLSKIILKENKCKKLNIEGEKIGRLCYEAMSYDTQFRNFNIGKRRLSNKFIQSLTKKYLDTYLELQDISEKQDKDSEFIKYLLNSLRYIPKKK